MRTTLRLLAKKIPVDGHCIPLTPPYSLAFYLPPATPLSRSTLLRLHALAALKPPAENDDAAWAALEDLQGLAGVMGGVLDFGRDSASSPGESQAGRIVDARVRGEETPILDQLGKPQRQEELADLTGLAEEKRGAYYVVRTPVGIRGKVRKGPSNPVTEEE